MILLTLESCIHPNKVETNATNPLNSKINKAQWTQKSDQLALQFTKALSAIKPEIGSKFGLQEYDSKGMLLANHSDEIYRKLFVDWIVYLNKKQELIKDLELKTDYTILKMWLQNQVNTMDLGKKVREIEFFPATEFIYQNLEVLINSQTSLERKKNAVNRFRVYVRGDNKHSPLLEASQAIFRNHWKEYKGKEPLLPYIGEVEEYLKNTSSYMKGIEDLLKQSGRIDWADDWQKFVKQNQDFNNFIKKEILPFARKDARVPKELYAQILEQRGIDSTPDQLISVGLSDYKSLFVKFQEQAKIVAEKHKLSNPAPAEVIKFLKSKPVSDLKQVEALYQKTNQRLEKIITEHNLVSLPRFPLKIRVAGDAESKAIPVPHLKEPPLVNNNGERPEFVVPSYGTGLPFDDFSSEDAAMIFTAHEGRPGHDLQFSQMLDQGVSIIRSRYAMNSVNVEGWALYAEDLVYPFLTPEEKLFALQTRLWRIARMFLDPQLQLLQISDQRVIELFTQELGVSKEMAQLELQRYKYSDLGQAPSYYFGYLIIQKMLQDAQTRLGKEFSLKCFNDRLLSFGLLPLRITEQRIKDGPYCLQ